MLRLSIVFDIPENNNAISVPSGKPISSTDCSNVSLDQLLLDHSDKLMRVYISFCFSNNSVSFSM